MKTNYSMSVLTVDIIIPSYILWIKVPAIVPYFSAVYPLYTHSFTIYDVETGLSIGQQ